MPDSLQKENLVPDIGKLINISTQVHYIEQHSDPEQERFVFSYTITITNNSAEPVQLMARRWLITDANGENSTVEGEGVVGEQPKIPAGKSHTYTSGSVFKTPLGIMQGQYQMQTANGQEFTALIPVFTLSLPNLVN